MVKLKEIPRTAAFAWSPSGSDPLLVTGTVAGAVDADFSSTTQLELWDLSLLDRSPEAFDLSPRVSLDTNASSFASHTKHTGAIKSLEFNHIQKNVIATGGLNGEIYIWDLKNLDKAITPGRTPSRQEDVEAIAWNNGVTHILASGSSSGTSVWDLKNRKEVIHLSYTTPGVNGHSPVSSIAWHPDNSTTLITASSNEISPVILLWDLRNANAPQKVIQGHDKGILSLDWCKQDSTFLLSSGKDNKTFLWDVTDGSKIGEYPVTSNWNFQTSFSSHYPDIFASASYDGKITIQTLQDTNTATKKETNVDSDDFWNSNNYVDAQHPVVSLKSAPKWLKRPCSATFGFGGKIISVKSSGNSSTVSITKFTEDESLTSETSKFAAALKDNKISDIISDHLSSSEGTEHHDWELLQLINSGADKAALKKFIWSEEESAEGELTEASETNTKSAGEDNLFDGADGEDFLSDLSISNTYEPSGSFQIYGSEISATEKNITKAVLAGDFDKAVNIALKQESFADAFALAANASEATRNKVQNAYLSKNAEAKPFLRILASASSKNLTDLVINSDVAEWKDVLGAVFTFAADDATFRSLVSQLGDRLLDAKTSVNSRNNALFCYLAASNVAGASSIWVKEINEQEVEILKASSDSQTPYSAHVKALHKFIEKITIFKNQVKITQDDEKNLDQLYDAYREYANIVATQGQLDLAEIFLNFLPSQYAGASLEKERVLTANKKVTTSVNKNTKVNPVSSFTYPAVKPTPAANSFYKPAAPAASGSLYAPEKPAASSNPYSAQPAVPASPYAPVQSNPSPYAPQSASQPNAYAPQAASQSNAYAPPPIGKPQSPVPTNLAPPKQHGHNRTSSGIYTPTNPIINTYSPPTATGYGASAHNPPPVMPPPKRDSKGGWNDLPTSGLPQPTSRRATPAAASAIPNPFANQFQPLGANNAIGRQTSAPLAPPPSGPPPPGSSRSGSISSVTPDVSTPSAAPVNPYAPKIGSPAASKASPYAPYGGQQEQQGYFPPNPASAAPPVNPYAAAAATPPVNPYAAAPAPNLYGSPAGLTSPPNPYGAAVPAAAPPSNPYAPNPAAIPQGPQSGYAPPPGNGYGQPPQGMNQPPHGGYPPQGNGYGRSQDSYHASPPQASTPQPPAPVEPLVEETPKHPPGDRSHISDEALPIYQLLEQELNKVKPQVPATYKRQVDDIEKRLGILFDHLNNDDLLSPETVTDMIALSQALVEGNYDTAAQIRLAILTARTDECGQWMPGVKRLIDMSRVIAGSAQ
ncbi:hypothetical protein D0Z00_002662 [Geotrichum galactomycetum]|uniref:Uncharacterized protein n=1 Tax=Geotrichum galactomycetum TaxID=27317 RepID=A0ACB6V3E5_9ASCO|nr:hypothetical protein D0Z00_002662 [Geotrichum candidum]